MLDPDISVITEGGRGDEGGRWVLSLHSSCSRYFRRGHLPRDAAKGMLIEESTAAEMRGKGKEVSRLIPVTNSEG